MQTVSVWINLQTGAIAFTEPQSPEVICGSFTRNQAFTIDNMVNFNAVRSALCTIFTGWIKIDMVIS
jgi:hypothetical protein